MRKWKYDKVNVQYCTPHSETKLMLCLLAVVVVFVLLILFR